MSFSNIKACLEAGDQEKLRTLFTTPERKSGEPPYPTVLPIGRFELDFGADAVLERGAIAVREGVITVTLSKAGKSYQLYLYMDMQAPVVCIECPAALEAPAIHRVPTWEYVGEYLAEVSFAAPHMLDTSELLGWVQTRPADPPLCVGCQAQGRELYLTAVIGEDADSAEALARTTLDAATAEEARKFHERATAWWEAYWKAVPNVKVPNERLQFIYDYGMYKFAGLTNPAGVPATLHRRFLGGLARPRLHRLGRADDVSLLPVYVGHRLPSQYGLSVHGRRHARL